MSNLAIVFYCNWRWSCRTWLLYFIVIDGRVVEPGYCILLYLTVELWNLAIVFYYNWRSSCRTWLLYFIVIDDVSFLTLDKVYYFMLIYILDTWYYQLLTLTVNKTFNTKLMLVFEVRYSSSSSSILGPCSLSRDRVLVKLRCDQSYTRWVLLPITSKCYTYTLVV